MTLFLLIFFAGECVFLVAWGLRKPGRICEFPFLAGATFGGFVLPQSIGLFINENLASAILNKTLVMSILCAGMCYLGYLSPRQTSHSPFWEFEEDRLLVASAVLSVIGAFFFFLISRLSAEQTEVAQWTGLPVVYLFFAQFLHYGFAMAILLYARTRSKLALGIALFGSLVFFDWIVIRARRGMTIEFALCILCALWFGRRWTLPRVVMPFALIAGVIAVFSVGAYRAAVYQDQIYGGTLRHAIPWDEIVQIDYVDVFRTSVEHECWELRNAGYHIQDADWEGDFDWGLSYWNELVFAYVPAQLVGADLKSALMLELPGDPSRNFDYDIPPGTTFTGMADSFRAFWYLGCSVFFIIGFVNRKLFEGAQAGSFALQLIYMLMITSAMHTITHHTKWFVTPWVHIVVFLVPWLFWARKTDKQTELAFRACA